MTDDSYLHGPRTTGVTVVLGVYNGEEFLPEQLQSLLAQTLPPASVVIADDNSTDRTVEIAEAFEAAAPFPVTVLRHPHLGMTRNFLRAAATVTTELIAWCDHDDVWEPTKLERCVAALQEHHAVLVFHDVTIVDVDLAPLGRSSVASWSANIRGDEVLERFAGRQWECFNGFATVFRAELLDGVDETRFPESWTHPGRLFHDEAVHELARLTGRRVVLAQPLAKYRKHRGSITGDARRAGVADRLRTGGEQYARRSQVADQTRAWVGSLPSLSADAEVVGHLERLVRDQRLRLDVYETAGRIPRLLRVLRGVESGSYRARRSGGHGALGLVKDLLVASVRHG